MGSSSQDPDLLGAPKMGDMADAVCMADHFDKIQKLPDPVPGAPNFRRVPGMVKYLKDIKECRSTQVPLYDFKTNSRVEGEFTVIHPSDVVLLEGILVFYYKEVRDLFDMKLFVDTDADTRLARRVLRDIEERGRDLENVLFQYTNLVKPAFEEFCMPTKKHADVIIPRGADNKVAVNLVAQHILNILTSKNGGSTISKANSPTTRSRSNSDSLIR